MYWRPNKAAREILALSCVILLIPLGDARGQTSMSFDGISSKLQNDSANVLAGSDEITICAWVYPVSMGENNVGILFALDPTGSGMWSQFVPGPAITYTANFGTNDGGGTYPLALGTWTAVAMSYKSSYTTVPTCRMNFATVPSSTTSNPSGSLPAYGTGYCIGNISGQNFTWNGRIAHVQIFNRILSAVEMDACLRAPGSIRNGLRVWLPMTNATDVNDRSGNGFHATATNVTTGTDGPMLYSPITLPAGTILIPPATDNAYAGATRIDQLVIPRYRSATNFPAGQVYGLGPQSVLAATTNTQSQSVKAIVKTEDYGQAIAEWQAGSAGYVPAVLQPHLVNCTVAGYTPDDWGFGGAVNQQPQIYNQSDPDLYGGYFGQANGGVVDNVTFFFIPGTALEIKRNATPISTTFKPHDRLKWVVSRLNVRRVYRGIWNRALDSYMHDIEVEGFRDYGVRIGDNLSGAVQFSRIHAYGGGFAAELNGSGGAAIWIEGHNCQGTDIYPENAPIGLLISGGHNALDGLYSHSCATANVRITGSDAKISKFRLGDNSHSSKFVSAIGFDVSGQYTTITDGSIEPKDSAIGLKFTNGTHQIVRDVTINSYLYPNTTGIKVLAQLNNCIVVAFMRSGGVGFDANDSANLIGSNNYIWFTTEGTTTPHELPTNVTTTVNANDSNQIYINGVRYYKQP